MCRDLPPSLKMLTTSRKADAAEQSKTSPQYLIRDRLRVVTGFWLILAGSITSCGSSANTDAPLTSPVIFDRDVRKEHYELTPNSVEKDYAESVAMLVSSARLRDLGTGFYELKTDAAWRIDDRVKEQFGHPMCRDEKFAMESGPGFCTAFAIGPRRFMTAGHCIPKEVIPGDEAKACPYFSVLMGYYRRMPLDPRGYDAFTTVPANDVRRCGKVIAHRNDDLFDYAIFDIGDDEAPIAPRIALPLAENAPRSGRTVWTWGHPRGLSGKHSDGKVKSVSVTELQTSTAIQAGASGSPLFEGDKVVGIQVSSRFWWRAKDDFVLSSERSLTTGQQVPCVRHETCWGWTGCPGYTAAQRVDGLLRFVPERTADKCTP